MSRTLRPMWRRQRDLRHAEFGLKLRHRLLMRVLSRGNCRVSRSERNPKMRKEKRHMPPLLALPPGTRFRLIEMEEITGTLVNASESRAVVRLDRPEQEVEFRDPDTGELRAF